MSFRMPSRQAAAAALLAGALLVTALPGAAAPQSVAAQLDAEARSQLAQLAQDQGLAPTHTRISILPSPALNPPARCAVPLEIEAIAKPEPGRLRYRFRCPQPGGFSGEANLRAEWQLPVLVSRQRIAAGSLLGEDDVGTSSRVLPAGGDYLADPAALAGWSARRSIKPGEVLRQRMLLAASVVKRNQPVEIVASREGVVVRMEGLALDNGQAGQLIRVRNAQTQKVIHARVSGAGRVSPELD